MLWGIQFSHPHNKTNERFNIYPFRLIFKLLLDKRLNNKLYVDEISYIVMFVESIKNSNQYTSLVNKILEFRELNDDEISSIFRNDVSNNLVNAVYEWDYYVKNVLSYFNLIESFEGNIITKLNHGTSTVRYLKKSFIKIESSVREFLTRLESEFSLYDTPIELKSENYLTKEIKKEIYNFCPTILLEELNEDNQNYDILKLPKLINEFAQNPDGVGYDKFEDILEESFNMFYNVEANKRSGAGNTDIECIYFDLNKKFAVEAKSTKNKLSLVNSGRLSEHLRLIGGKYTIVITSRYVPAVLHDIKNTNIVILLANTFSEFIYNNLINNNREIDFKLFDDIIERKLGSDISSEISKLTLENFANI
ncbi:MAG: restriction endonuclease [Candidatus Woesearchaeota archaeon]